MQREEFQKLTENERLEVVWDEGELIATRWYYSSTIHLFLVDCFFVEVFFENETNSIGGIIIQEHTEILYSYVKELDMTELKRLLTQ